MAIAAIPRQSSRVLTRSHGSEIVRALTLRRVGGFTLLEMMIVLVIVGIVAGLATLQLTRNPRRDLLEQARHLAAQFEAASDEASLRSEPIAWQPTPGGYRFEIHHEQRWVPLQDTVLDDTAWKSPVDAVEVRFGTTAAAASRVIFGIEPLGLPVKVLIHSPFGEVMIYGAGDGHFRAQAVH